MKVANHPKRLTPPAAPGALLKRFDAPEARAKRQAQAAHDPAYLAMIRELPCLYCGVEPCGEAAHVKMTSALFGKPLRFGKKPDDRWAVPLCRDDHQNARHAQHRQSEAAFWDGLSINPLLVATKLYAKRGDLVAMRAVVMVAIAERSKTSMEQIIHAHRGGR